MKSSQWGFNKLQRVETVTTLDPVIFERIAGGPHGRLTAQISDGMEGTHLITLVPTTNRGQYIILRKTPRPSKPTEKNEKQTVGL